VTHTKAKGRVTATDGETAPVELLGGNDAEATSKAPRGQTPRPPPPEPRPDANGLAGRRFGAWTAVRTDQSGKRVTCICSCGVARLVAHDALLTGESRGCGCSETPIPKAAPTSRPSSKFATGIAGAERFSGFGRHKGKGTL
jgi:hypothetical protein